MASAIRRKKVSDSYLALIRAFPLRPLRSEKDLDEAIRVVNALAVRPNLDASEEDYLDVLSDLVEKYETATHPMGPLPDSAMLRHLIEARGVAQTAVAKATGIKDSAISEVLAGKRQLSRTNVEKLADYFHVSPAVFSRM
jgi:HTH-type transcriptional regulator/antitoxin HigA